MTEEAMPKEERERSDRLATAFTNLISAELNSPDITNSDLVANVMVTSQVALMEVLSKNIFSTAIAFGKDPNYIAKQVTGALTEIVANMTNDIGPSARAMRDTMYSRAGFTPDDLDEHLKEPTDG